MQTIHITLCFHVLKRKRKRKGETCIVANHISTLLSIQYFLPWFLTFVSLFSLVATWTPRKFHNMACQAREVALIFILFLFFFCFQRLWATDSNWKAPVFITETQLRRFAGHLSAKLLCSFRNVETTLWGVGVLIVSTRTWIYPSLKHRQVIIKKNFCSNEYTPTIKSFCLLFVRIVFTSPEQDAPHMFHQQSGFLPCFLILRLTSRKWDVLDLFFFKDETWQIAGQGRRSQKLTSQYYWHLDKEFRSSKDWLSASRGSRNLVSGTHYSADFERQDNALYKTTLCSY